MTSERFWFPSEPAIGTEIGFGDGEKFTLFGSRTRVDPDGSEDVALRWRHTAAHLIDDEVVETGLNFSADDLFENERLGLYLG